jgi:hypothetical protein
MMKTAWMAAFAAAALAAGGARGAPITRPELDALTKDIEANAKAWLEDKPVDESIERGLKGVTYDEKIIPALRAQLAARRVDPVDLYVATRLLRPMLMAKPEVVRLILPAVLPMQARATMRPFPKYPEAYFKQMKPPQYEGEVRPERLMADLARIEQLKKQKMAADRKVAQHNTEAAELTVTVGTLMIYAESPAFDGRAINLLLEQEQRERAAFLRLLEVIKAEAGKMDQRRARVYYSALREAGLRLKTARKQYLDYTKPNLQIMQNSSYEADGKEHRYPGVALLNVVNLLAPPARMPAVKVPSAKEIEAVYKRMEQQRKALEEQRRKRR